MKGNTKEAPSAWTWGSIRVPFCHPVRSQVRLDVMCWLVRGWECPISATDTERECENVREGRLGAPIIQVAAVKSCRGHSWRWKGLELESIAPSPELIAPGQDTFSTTQIRNKDEQSGTIIRGWITTAATARQDIERVPTTHLTWKKSAVRRNHQKRVFFSLRYQLISS